MKKIYFTYKPSSYAGFTDNLEQFSAFYKLGRALGYQYVPPTIDTSRSSAAILDFIGFNDIWKKHEIPDISENRIIDLQIRSSSRFFCNWLILRIYLSIILFIKFIPYLPGKILVRFSLVLGDSRAVFKVIEDRIHELPDGINLRNAYFLKHPQHAALKATSAIEKKIHVLVHSRQGDVTVLPTPWDTRLAIRSTKIKEYHKTTEVLLDPSGETCGSTLRTIQEYIPPKEYLRILRRLFEEIPSLRFIICSDGYSRSFRYLFKYIESLKLTEKQEESLREMATTYENHCFGEFGELPNTSLFIGETEDNLFALIHAALTSDIIITSFQQNMMIKLLSLYGRTIKPPHLVFLMNRATDLNSIKNKLKEKSGVIIGIDLSNADADNDYGFKQIFKHLQKTTE